MAEPQAILAALPGRQAYHLDVPGSASAAALSVVSFVATGKIGEPNTARIVLTHPLTLPRVDYLNRDAVFSSMGATSRGGERRSPGRDHLRSAVPLRHAPSRLARREVGSATSPRGGDRAAGGVRRHEQRARSAMRARAENGRDPARCTARPGHCRNHASWRARQVIHEQLQRDSCRPAVSAFARTGKMGSHLRHAQRPWDEPGSRPIRFFDGHRLLHRASGCGFRPLAGGRRECAAAPDEILRGQAANRHALRRAGPGTPIDRRHRKR